MFVVDEYLPFHFHFNPILSDSNILYFIHKLILTRVFTELRNRKQMRHLGSMLKGKDVTISFANGNISYDNGKNRHKSEC